MYQVRQDTSRGTELNWILCEHTKKKSDMEVKDWRDGDLGRGSLNYFKPVEGP